jgi:FixJ family two-component response regulator
MTSRNDEAGTVYVVDDDPAVLRMLEAMIATLGVKVRAFTSARLFLDEYLPAPVECLVCDLRMPDIDGIELQKRLKAIGAPLPMIFLTGFAEVSVAVEAMRQGALDFLEKPFSAQALLGKVQSGLDRSKHQHAQWREDQARQARVALLTPRERVIAGLVVDARSSREISEMLHLSVRTVENHRTRIMEKLHAESTVELVKLFL